MGDAPRRARKSFTMPVEVDAITLLHSMASRLGEDVDAGFSHPYGVTADEWAAMKRITGWQPKLKSPFGTRQFYVSSPEGPKDEPTPTNGLTVGLYAHKGPNLYVSLTNEEFEGDGGQFASMNLSLEDAQRLRDNLTSHLAAVGYE